MAEGLLGGLLGGEEEGDGSEAADALRLSPEALSAALALCAIGVGVGVIWIQLRQARDAAARKT